jgi:nucleoside-diphosphate-sugar epimerase
MVRSMRANGTAVIRGSGIFKRDYVYIEDLFRILRSLIQQPYAGMVNVATGKSYSIVELAGFVAEALGIAPAFQHDTADESRDFDLVFDNSLLRSVVADLTFTDIRAALASYKN